MKGDLKQGPFEVKTGGCYYFKEVGMGGIATPTIEVRKGKLRRLFYPGFVVKETARDKDYPTAEDCITTNVRIWIADSMATLSIRELEEQSKELMSETA